MARDSNYNASYVDSTDDRKLSTDLTLGSLLLPTYFMVAEMKNLRNRVMESLA